jgi:hypothetical protein
MTKSFVRRNVTFPTASELKQTTYDYLHFKLLLSS